MEVLFHTDVEVGVGTANLVIHTNNPTGYGCLLLKWAASWAQTLDCPAAHGCSGSGLCHGVPALSGRAAGACWGAAGAAAARQYI